MNRLKPKQSDYGLIKFNLKLPFKDNKTKTPEKMKQYIKKNLRISLVNKFQSPEHLERYLKSKKNKK